MDDLVKRLRERASGVRGPAIPIEAEAADRIEALEEIMDIAAFHVEALEARVAAADKLAEAGSVMSRALEGDYIVPGSAAKWNTALAAYKATKEQSDG